VAAGRGLSRAILSEEHEVAEDGPDPQLAMYGFLTIVQAASLAVADSTIAPTPFSVGGTAEKRHASTANQASSGEWKKTLLQRRLQAGGQLFLIALDAWREWLGTGVETEEGDSTKALLEKAVVGLAWTPIALDVILLATQGKNKRFTEKAGPVADAYFDLASIAATLVLNVVDGGSRVWDVAEGMVLTMGHFARIPLTADLPLAGQALRVRNVLQTDMAFSALGVGMVGQGLLGTHTA
jgi:hypothetical protein